MEEVLPSYQVAGLAKKISPDRSQATQSNRHRILSEMIVVKINFELLAIEVLKQRLEKKGAGVRTQIG